MKKEQKLLGEDRRNQILQLLKNSQTPITGTELAQKANVSRQIIVGDITLLKARNEPIIATSQGYMYLQPSQTNQQFERIIACSHSRDAVEIELNLLVDTGVTVKDVKVEHPVYGDLSASIMVSNRRDVQQFLQKIEETNAAYLFELTKGIHLHTISASSLQILDEAEAALAHAGILVTENE